jgi:hypothetical protein
VAYNSAMMFRTRPRDKKPDTRTHVRKMGDCDFCDKHGNFWHIRGEIICDSCLGLTIAKQKAIGGAHGLDGLYRKLDETLKQLTEGEPMERKIVGGPHTGYALEPAPVMEAAKENVAKVRAELKARAGKLYLIENAYVNASRRARKLADAAAAKVAAINAQVADTAREAKEAGDKFESEKLAIEELERKLLALKIGA